MLPDNLSVCIGLAGFSADFRAARVRIIGDPRSSSPDLVPGALGVRSCLDSLLEALHEMKVE